jgi:RNA polymerase sigma factor (sigma-70 family)
VKKQHVSTSDEDLVRLYLADISRYPLLTTDDEVRLARLIECGRAAREALAHETGRSGAELRALRRAVERGDAARRTFVQSNLRLVVSIARSYQSTGVDLLDLIQEGNFGLMHAVEKFDWRKGFKFSTYATWWIRQAIARGVAASNRTIRVPMHVGTLLRRLQQVRFTLTAELARTPTAGELAVELGVTADKVAALLLYEREPSSLSDAVTGDGVSIAELVSDPEDESPDDIAIRSALPAAVAKMLAPLDVREREVIELRFGLDGEPPHTLAQTGARLGLSAERIRQIERQALSRLRAAPLNDDVRELLSA